MPRGRKKGSKNKLKTVMAANPTNPTTPTIPTNPTNQSSKVNTESNSGSMTIAEAIQRKKNNTTDAGFDAKSAVKNAVANVTKSATNDKVDRDNDEDEDEGKDEGEALNEAMGSDVLNDLGYPQNRITSSMSSTASAAKSGSRAVQRPAARCDRCGGPILTAQPYTIDTATLTALAEWHRDVMPKRVNMCVMCAHELSEVVERWYLKNPNAKKKAYLK